MNTGIESGTITVAPGNQKALSGAELRLSSPLRIFLYFHKAIRAELDWLRRTSLALATNRGAGDIKLLVQKSHFLRSIYEHHCNAEDEVIFPALDSRVKNVARTYYLEHEGDKVLFNKLITMLDDDMKNEDRHKRELASSVGALRTSISKHTFKEEEQVFPLIYEKFSYEEQASLAWKFLCSIPVNVMAEFLPWLSSSLSPDEQHDIHKCLHKIVPDEKILQQIIFNWMDGVKTCSKRKHCEDDPGFFSSFVATEAESHGAVERDAPLSCGICMQHPVDDILHWHRAIEKELNGIAEAARSIKLAGDVSDLSTITRRLQFIAEVNVFHSIAEDKIIFPAVNAEMSFLLQHGEEKSEFDKFRCLIESIESAGGNLSVEMYSELCSQADHIVEVIKNHFVNEETQVFPLARKHFSLELQQELVYHSLCVMPLRLVECVLPWLVGSLTDEEARRFLYNMHVAAPASDTALVTLFCGWACKGCPGRIYPSSGAIGCCNAKEFKETPEHNGISCLYCADDSTSTESAIFEQVSKHVKTVPKGDLVSSVESNAPSASDGVTKASLANRPYSVTGLGVSSTGVGEISLATAKSLRVSSFGSGAPLNSSLFNWETGNSFSGSGTSARPIDNIFKFHKAIRKDLEFLAVESGKLGDSDENFIRNFSGRFHRLWGLYRAHSDAEDDILFPALESKETLHNISHSYTLDHKQEENLFEDISSVLAKFSRLQEKLNANIATGTLGKSHLESLSQANCLTKYNELATKIQGMCTAIKVAIDDHVMREEVVLWPLFEKHFSVEEQEKLVGRIIGTTGAEMLKSMLPWVISALTQEEQDKMMDTWKRATRKTMFSDWLNEWWEEVPASSSQASAFKNSISQESDMHELMEQSGLFKPGPKDIFQMNQNELKLEIRKVSCDSTLDPGKRDSLTQNSMTSQWIASQQKFSQSRNGKADDGIDLLGLCQSFRDSDKQIFGCKHYKRNCKIRAACCRKLFPCRFCHDEVSDHSMDRKAISEMMCYNCLQIQPVGPVCSTPSCSGLSMAKYYCPSCRLFDDDERDVYHCPFCNLCRVGKGLGVDVFHCMNCNCCLAKKVPEHKCWEKSLETNCPICCDYLFTSSAVVKDLPCGHYMHIACYHKYGYTHYICPICSKSMGDMSKYFGMLDALLASEVLPEEYRNLCQDILCNDCDRKGTASFHWLYHKCGFCGSYNTKLIKVDQERSCSSYTVS